jgi:Domain of unknown function (DUF4396)
MDGRMQLLRNGAWASLILAGLSTLTVAVDLAARREQKMWIMYLVWPLTALWAGPLGLWAYLRFGSRPDGGSQPFPAVVGKATLHCGAGCTLGDLIAETFAAGVPLVVFGQKMFGAWVYDYALALLLGIGFQYFTIKPMRGLSVGDGLVQAVKVDFLSLTAWQLGMYGWMAVVRFALFGRELPKSDPTFWFMMQLAMFLGFATAYPLNWWLVRKGIKEQM